MRQRCFDVVFPIFDGYYEQAEDDRQQNQYTIQNYISKGINKGTISPWETEIYNVCNRWN